MELQKSHKKVIAVVTAVILLITAVITVILNIGDTSAAENKKTGESGKSASAKKYDPEDEEFVSNTWWKANLSDYSENLSLISCEKLETPEGKNSAAAKKRKNDYGFVVNDTGISYIEHYEDKYEAIQIVPDDSNYSVGALPPPQRPATSAVSVSPGDFAFTTYGYGHGVGLSQNGANHYAYYSGWNYQQILAHYYQGATIQKTAVRASDRITAGDVRGTVADIVSMVTYNEVGGTMATEAIKAQAVAVYTYIMYKGGDAPDLIAKPNPPQNVKDAVNSVLGEALFYDGDYILAMFCASSGGSTAACADIFYQDIPYLRSVPCEYDSDYDPHYGTVDVRSAEEVRAELESNLGITLSSDPNNWVNVIEGDGGYAAYVDIDGQVTVKGNEFRAYLGLKSPKFDVKYYN